MSRRKKRPHGRRNADRKPAREPTFEEAEAALINESAHLIACSFETAASMLHQCRASLEDLDFDIALADATTEAWTTQPAPPGELVALLRDFREARRRHQAALEALEPRIRALVAAEDHTHITPEASLHDVIRKHLRALVDRAWVSEELEET